MKHSSSVRLFYTSHDVIDSNRNDLYTNRVARDGDDDQLREDRMPKRASWGLEYQDGLRNKSGLIAERARSMITTSVYY